MRVVFLVGAFASMMRSVAALDTPQAYAVAPQQYYAQPQYAENLWEIPPPPEARVALRPFRLATQSSVTFVYALIAWRSTSLGARAAQFGTPLGFLGKPLFLLNAAGGVVAARGASKHKKLLKAILGLDLGLEALTFAVSLLNALFPSGSRLSPDAHGLNALCAFWMGLICYTCSRSKWIASLPPPRPRGANDPALRPYGGVQYGDAPRPIPPPPPPPPHGGL